jgi:hypothetical protein
LTPIINIFTIIILALLCITPVAAEGFMVTINDQSVVAGSKAVIPVHITNAEELGEMNLEISYDPSVIKFSGIGLGSISKNGIIETTETVPGTILLNLVDSAGISQDGEIFILTFDVLGTKGSSSLIRIVPKGIYNLDKKDIPVNEQSGTISVNGAENETPLPACIALLAILFVGIIAISIRRKS